MKVTIFTGEINSGKSSNIFNYFQKEQKGDGWISEKIFENQEHIGYNILRLSTNESVTFIRDRNHTDTNWKSILERGNWNFSEEGFNISQKWGEEILSQNTSPIYIDEIGKIELDGLLFRAFLEKCITAKREIILGVRDVFVEEVLEIFPSFYEKEIILRSCQ